MINNDFLKKLIILYVEDDETTREQLSKLLKRLFKTVVFPVLDSIESNSLLVVSSLYDIAIKYSSDTALKACKDLLISIEVVESIWPVVLSNL